MRKPVVGIMGPGKKATPQNLSYAYALGKMCAERGYVTLTGGSPLGVMEAALKGARENGGQTLGILPYQSKAEASGYADIVVVTAMMSARNNINVLSSDVVIACGLEAGTLSEIALALKAEKHVILLSENQLGNQFLEQLGTGSLTLAPTPEQAMAVADKLLASPAKIVA